MRIISFAKTTPAVKARRKCATRRDWARKHAESFKASEELQAWDHVPRVKGAARFGTIRLLEKPYEQSTHELRLHPDFEEEGFAYLEEQGLDLGKGVSVYDLWGEWVNEPRVLWVVRYEILELYDEATR